ncbi:MULTISPECIES: hypothetical protein [Stenotrophomonas]|uniref:hypothetical protein n=1 Tax=Stenotrophomonas TaxID=40323 RepID=UPI000885BB9B|nr:hypothetical protein [Stenotrophomonas pavanii]SDK71250.1 hypothetical protein SAMN04487784_3099 [Stenotrophomonas pavanii]
MMRTNHFHDRIQRATQQLAQLQARELLATQRRESKAKEQAKRDEARRRARIGELAFLARAEALEDAELVGALRIHLQNRNKLREQASDLGAAWLLAISLGTEAST